MAASARTLRLEWRGIYFPQDNDTKYTSKMNQVEIQNQGIAKASVDLKRLENLWSQLKDHSKNLKHKAAHVLKCSTCRGGPRWSRSI